MSCVCGNHHSNGCLPNTECRFNALYLPQMHRTTPMEVSDMWTGASMVDVQLQYMGAITRAIHPVVPTNPYPPTEEHLTYASTGRSFVPAKNR
jgi:hypothetical protein